MGVNWAPVAPKSHALSEPAGESKSCFPHVQNTKSFANPIL